MSSVYESIKYGFDNVLNTPLVKGWEESGLAFMFLTGLGAEIDLTKTLTKEQRKVLSDFFTLTMYFNRYLDPLIFRLTNPSQSYETIEKFWNFPQKEKELLQSALDCGYKPVVVEEIHNWFELNRRLNIFSLKEVKDDYQEKQTIISKAILFRALSSMCFAKTLLELSLNKIVDCSDLRLRALAGTVMVSQTIDDFGSPVKDVKYQILGTSGTMMDEPQVKGGALFVNGKDTQKCIELSRQIIGGSLDFINDQEKEKIYYWGALLCSLITISQFHKYGGTRYSPIPAIKTFAKEVYDSLGKRDGGEYKKITKESLEEAISILAPNLS